MRFSTSSPRVIHRCFRQRLAALGGVVLLLLGGLAQAELAERIIRPGDPLPSLTYHGLVPGLDTLQRARAALGKPLSEGLWGRYRIFYPAEGRPGQVDVVHLDGQDGQAEVATIEASSIPAGYETESAIRAKLGVPDYELRMATWRLLDYSADGVRFTVDGAGATTGVAYIPATARGAGGQVVDLRARPARSATREAVAGSPLRAGAAEMLLDPAGGDGRESPFGAAKVRAVVFASDRACIAFVGADVAGLSSEQAASFALQGRPLGVQQVVLSCAPGQGRDGRRGDDAYRLLTARLPEVLRIAMNNLAKVGELRGGSKELPMEGTRVLGVIRNALTPGVLDPSIATIQALTAEGVPIATLVNFSFDAQLTLPRGLSRASSFIAVMCDELARRGAGQTIFLNGALAGATTEENLDTGGDLPREIGLRMANWVLDALGDAEASNTHELRVRRRALTVPGAAPTAEGETMDAEGQAQLTAQTPAPERPQPAVTYVRLGSADIVALPFQVLPGVGFQVLEGMSGAPRVLIGLGPTPLPKDMLGELLPLSTAPEDERGAGGASYGIRDMALRMVRGAK